MPLIRSLKRKARAAVPPLLFLSLLGYFWWNSVNGEHGIKATALRRQDLATARAELARAEADRAGWQRRVSGLQGAHLDPDTLDERARAMLNAAEPGDIVAPYGKAGRLF